MCTKADTRQEPEHCAQYYSGFFVTVIGDSYKGGAQHVQFTPEHVEVLKSMLKDYGMCECRRKRDKQGCTFKRRSSDKLVKWMAGHEKR